MDQPEMFPELERFCVFVGEPRSGHSVLGTLINAHRNALISHNLDVLDLLRSGLGRADILQRIRERDRWMARRNREIGGYRYEVPGTWLGWDDAVRVIGDKRAGATSRYLYEEPDLLSRLQETIGLPLCVIHHVRNPWDNISSICTRKTLGQERTLEETTDYYFQMLEGCVRGLSAMDPSMTLLRTYHEDMIRDPETELPRIFAHLELPLDEAFLGHCLRFIHPAPRQTRHDVNWPAGLIADIESRIRRYGFLDRYAFEMA